MHIKNHPPLSIYNVKPFKTKNNQIFYPVEVFGQVNMKKDVKADYAKRLPKSKNYFEGHGIDKNLHHSNKGQKKKQF